MVFFFTAWSMVVAKIRGRDCACCPSPCSFEAAPTPHAPADSAAEGGGPIGPAQAEAAAEAAAAAGGAEAGRGGAVDHGAQKQSEGRGVTQMIL